MNQISRLWILIVAALFPRSANAACSVLDEMSKPGSDLRPEAYLFASLFSVMMLTGIILGLYLDWRELRRKEKDAAKILKQPHSRGAP